MERHTPARARWASAISRIIAQRRTAASRSPVSTNAAAGGAAAAVLAGAGARRASLRTQILTSQPMARSRHDLLIIDSLLQQAEQLGQLSRAVRHALARHARLQTFAAGDVVCRGGEPVDRLIVTISGPVDIVPLSQQQHHAVAAGKTGDTGFQPFVSTSGIREPPLAGVGISSSGVMSASGARPQPSSPLAAATAAAAPPTLRPACFGASCLRPYAAAVSSPGLSSAGAVYSSTAVAAGRVEAMVIPADRVAAVIEAEAASPDVPAIKAVLRALPCLCWLPDGPLTALAADASLRRYTAGEVIFAQGRDAEAFGFLVAGAVRLFRAVAVPPEALAPRRLRGLLLRAERDEAYAAVFGQSLSIDAAGSNAGNSSSSGPPVGVRDSKGTSPQGDGGSSNARRQSNGGWAGQSGGGAEGQQPGAAEFNSSGRLLQQQQAPAAAAVAGTPAALRSAMRRPLVPPLTLPGAAADAPAATATPGSGSASGAASARSVDGGLLTSVTGAVTGRVTPQTAGAASEGWVPLVHAIEAAMRWAARPRLRTAAASGSSSSGAKTPGGALRSGFVTSRRTTMAATTPWGAKTPSSKGREQPSAVPQSARPSTTGGALLRGGGAVPKTPGGHPGQHQGTAAAGQLVGPSSPPGQSGNSGGRAPRAAGAGKGVRWSVATPSLSDSSDPWGRPGSQTGSSRDDDAAPQGTAPRSLAATPSSKAAASPPGGTGGEGLAGPAADWPRVILDLGRLSPGQCFGDVREGCAKGPARYSAVADVPCDVLVVSRSAAARALGPRLLALLAEADPEGRCCNRLMFKEPPPRPAAGTAGATAAGGAAAAMAADLATEEAALRSALSEALSRDSLKALLAAERAEAAARRDPIRAA